MAAAGIIGSVAKQYFSFMGHITGSHLDELIENNAPEVAASFIQDHVDAVLLRPGWCICNQSVELIQREIERKDNSENRKPHHPGQRWKQLHITIDDTEQISKRYNRIAFFYNLLEAPVEWPRFRQWRNRLRTKITGPMVLEAGVGTGKNLHHYPPDVAVTAIDFSPRMLSYAKKSASKLDVNVEFHLMDVQQLDFPDNSFDTVFGTFVFCSVPDPLMGLRELKRVCKSNGRLLLLEHVRPGNSILDFF